jgi:hypothetical protein
MPCFNPGPLDGQPAFPRCVCLAPSSEGASRADAPVAREAPGLRGNRFTIRSLARPRTGHEGSRALCPVPPGSGAGDPLQLMINGGTWRVCSKVTGHGPFLVSGRSRPLDNRNATHHPRRRPPAREVRAGVPRCGSAHGFCTACSAGHCGNRRNKDFVRGFFAENARQELQRAADGGERGRARRRRRLCAHECAHREPATSGCEFGVIAAQDSLFMCVCVEVLGRVV